MSTVLFTGLVSGQAESNCPIRRVGKPGFGGPCVGGHAVCGELFGAFVFKSLKSRPLEAHMHPAGSSQCPGLELSCIEALKRGARFHFTAPRTVKRNRGLPALP